MENNLNSTLAAADQVINQRTPSNNAADIVSAFATHKEEEVSLKTLKKSEIDKIMKSFKEGKDRADSYYKESIANEIKKREDVYNATVELYKKKFPNMSEKTSWRSMDVKATIEWIMPSMLAAFTDGEDPVDIKGAGVEDDIVAEKIQKLLKYQLERKNSYYTFMLSVLTEAFKTNFGIAKCYWKHDEKREKYEFLWDGNTDVMLPILKSVQKGEYEIKKMEAIPDAPDLQKISMEKIIVTHNQPVVEYVPPYELRFTPDGTNLQNCKFVAHRKIVTGDYLKRKELEGTYRNVDKAILKTGDTQRTHAELMKNDELNSDSGLRDNDNASKPIELYEAYLNVDYNNDGIMEKVIVHAVGSVPLRISLNEFEMTPFFVCNSVYNPCKVFGDESFSEILEQFQDLKTAMFRQIIINVAKNNVPQSLVDTRYMDVDALLNGDEYVPINPDGNIPINNMFYPVQVQQVSPLAMQVIDRVQSDIENISGSTRYNQGMDSNSLNKTATGITAIMGAADKKIRMVARQIAENFFVPLIRALILYNQKFLEPQQMIRLTNENVVITKDEIDIDYDLIINVGQGAGTKEAQIQYLMLLLGQLMPQWLQLGIAKNDNVYNVAKELLEKMGLRNAGAFIRDPKSKEAMAEAQQAQQAAMQQQQQLLAMQQQAEERKNQVDMLKAFAPNLSMKYSDLPPEAQKEILNFLGINIDTFDILQKELMNNERNVPKPPPQNQQPGNQQGAYPAAAQGQVERAGSAR